MSDNRRPSVFFCLLAAPALALAFSGCVTAPRGAIPTYTIAGTPYVPLDAVCAAKGIRSDYDGLTRTVSLTKDSSDVRLQVGRRDVVSNGRFSMLSSPVDLYRGMIVIPQELRQKFEELFPERQVQAPLSLKKIVVDAGHGGKDPGTTGRDGVVEKEVVLDIARRVRDVLKKEGVEVVMTRSTDVFIPLDERSEITNKNNPDIFLSIHANANHVRSMKGFEVYYISPAVSDTKRAMASARYGTLNLDSACFLSPTQNLKAILWDMTYAYDRRESIEISRMLCKAMRSNLDTKVIGVKNANYAVLRGSTIPAVLVEVGFLSNPAEEALIADGAYRQKLADSIVEGLRYYCEGRDRCAPGHVQQTLVKGDR